MHTHTHTRTHAPHARTHARTHAHIFILIIASCILSIMHCYLTATLSKWEALHPSVKLGKYLTSERLQEEPLLFFSHIWFTSAPSPRILLCQSHFSTRRSDSAGLRLNFRHLLHIPRAQRNSAVMRPHIRASLTLACVEVYRHAIIIIAPPLQPVCAAVKRENAWAGNAMHIWHSSTLRWDSAAKRPVVIFSISWATARGPPRDYDELQWGQWHFQMQSNMQDNYKTTKPSD